VNTNPGFEPPEQEVQQMRSLLLLGRRGVGKTTLLRDIARLMSASEEQGGLGLAVVVVDTYCDIAGEHHAVAPQPGVPACVCWLLHTVDECVGGGGGLGLAVVVVDTYCDIAGGHLALGWCFCLCLWLFMVDSTTLIR
jgi:energy-coupling factor transporter ATP-binding protein EcfA2